MTTPTLPASHPFTTVRDLLRYAVSRFTAAGLVFGHGSENAYDEAAYLILHTLHLPIDTLEPFLDARLLPEEVAAVLKVIERRAVDRVPAAYITHEAFMHGMRFYVDERVIVPRSFIGELLEDGLEPWIDQEDGPTDSWSCAPARAACRFWRRCNGPVRRSMRWTCRRMHWWWPIAMSTNTACKTASACMRATCMRRCRRVCTTT